MYITVADLKKFDTFAIEGNTYPHREALRSIGAVYNPDKKRWTLRLASGNHGKQVCAASFSLSKVGVSFVGVR